MNRLLFILMDESTETSESSGGGTTEKLTEALKNMVKSPIFYIVIGAIVLLIIVLYLIRRIIKPSHNEVKVIVRSGKIHKLIDESSPKYFMVPFRDSLGAVISLNDRELNSDKLFINNGPDALYKINYTLTYKVVDVQKYFPVRDNYQNIIVIKINDKLREYADNGHALEIVESYRENADKIISLINELNEEYGVEVTSLKVNFIEPIGKK